MTNTQQSLFDEDGKSELPWKAAPEVAFAEWITQARSSRGNVPYNAVSRNQFISMWGQLCAFMRTKKISVFDLTPPLLNEFLVHQHGVQGAQLAPVTRRRYLSLLDKVFVKLVFEGKHSSNPAHELLKHEKTELAVPEVAHLKSRQTERFIETVQELPVDSWKDCRDKTMMLLIPGSGITQAEILRLGVSDVFLDDTPPHITVQPHSVRDIRAVSLSPFSIEALKVWLQRRNVEGITASELFPAKRSGGCLNGSTLYRHVAAVLDSMGFQEQKGARRLRHTFAMRQLVEGRPPEAVKDWLGLKTDEMLIRYGKLVPNKHGVTAA